MRQDPGGQPPDYFVFIKVEILLQIPRAPAVIPSSHNQIIREAFLGLDIKINLVNPWRILKEKRKRYAKPFTHFIRIRLQRGRRVDKPRKCVNDHAERRYHILQWEQVRKFVSTDSQSF